MPNSNVNDDAHMREELRKFLQKKRTIPTKPTKFITVPAPAPIPVPAPIPISTKTTVIGKRSADGIIPIAVKRSCTGGSGMEGIDEARRHLLAQLFKENFAFNHALPHEVCHLIDLKPENIKTRQTKESRFIDDLINLNSIIEERRSILMEHQELLNQNIPTVDDDELVSFFDQSYSRLRALSNDCYQFQKDFSEFNLNCIKTSISSLKSQHHLQIAKNNNLLLDIIQ